jgi:hypothetical protein
MDRESMQRLRLDRRLIRRPGWLSQEELERELAALPDVSHKIAPVGGESSAPPEQMETLPTEAPEQMETLPTEAPEQMETLPAESPEQMETLPAESPEQMETLPAESPEQTETLPTESPEEPSQN